MKQLYLFIIAVALTACSTQPKELQEVAAPDNYKEQLFVFSEAGATESCGATSGDSILFGGMLLTDKGNIIVNFQTTDEDTTRCFYGTYRFVDKNITYTLSNVFSFKGVWSGNTEPIAEGHAHTIANITDTLYATHCANEQGYYRTFSKKEELLYGISGAHKTPEALYYMPYKETENMKFFSWFFRQVPALENL